MLPALSFAVNITVWSPVVIFRVLKGNDLHEYVLKHCATVMPSKVILISAVPTLSVVCAESMRTPLGLMIDPSV